MVAFDHNFLNYIYAYNSNWQFIVQIYVMYTCVEIIIEVIFYLNKKYRLLFASAKIFFLECNLVTKLLLIHLIWELQLIVGVYPQALLLLIFSIHTIKIILLFIPC